MRKPDYEGVVALRPKKRRKAFTRLFSVTRKVPLADDRFFIQMEICVPHPTLDAPRAAIFVFLQSSNGRMWFSLASVADLRTLFLLNEQDGAAISDALAKATSIAQGYQVAKVELDSVLHGIAGLT